MIDCEIIIDYALRVVLFTLSGKVYHFQLFGRKSYFFCGSPLIDLSDVFGELFSVFIE